MVLLLVTLAIVWLIVAVVTLGLCAAAARGDRVTITYDEAPRAERLPAPTAVAARARARAS
jgi:hypothetical protein